MLVQMPSARKGKWSHTTWVSLLTTRLSAIRGWHYCFRRQFCESAPPLPLLIPDETSWPLNSFGMTKAAFPSKFTLLHSTADTAPLWHSCFFSMSLHSFFLIFIFPFPGYILPPLCALLSCLSNVVLLFSLKFPLPRSKSLGYIALQGWVIILERSLNEWL